MNDEEIALALTDSDASPTSKQMPLEEIVRRTKDALQPMLTGHGCALRRDVGQLVEKTSRDNFAALDEQLRSTLSPLEATCAEIAGTVDGQGQCVI